MKQPVSLVETSGLKDHVVIVGYGRVGKHLVDVLESLEVPILLIEADMERIEAINQRKIATLYGDAANSEVITHAHLESARALVSTLPDETQAALLVTAAHDIAPDLPIIARSATEDGVELLARLGANYIVQPELEGGLELVHHTLLQLGFPLRKVHEYAEAVRRDHYNIEITTDAEHRSLHELMMAIDIEISWMEIKPDSPLVGMALADTNIRQQTGASVVTLIRDRQVYPNPKSNTVFAPGDRIGVIGEPEQIKAAQNLVDGVAVHLE